MPLSTCDLIAFVATARPDEAKAFYRDVLDLTLVEDSPFALVFDANGTMLRVAKVDRAPPPVGTVLGWRVADISAAMTEIVAKGVAFEHHAGMTDADGVRIGPNGDKVAWFLDPDGNRLSLTEFA